MKSRNRLNITTQNRLSLRVKIMSAVGGATTLIAAGLLLTGIGGTTTETTGPGSWSSSSVWSNGVPQVDATAKIYHSLTLDNDINISGGTYTINAPVTDETGGNSYTVSISGSSSSDGVLDVNANTDFEGAFYVNAHGDLIIRSGDTLTVGSTFFDNGSSVNIEEGGVLVVNGDLTNKNNSAQVVVNGTIIVNGNLTGGNGSVISGSGEITTTGSMTGDGSIFGISPLTCSGPCTGRSLPGFTNTIGSNQSICSGSTPATLTGTTSVSSPNYQWQKSTDNTNYSNISGANSASYSPGALTVTTWYRRIVKSGGISSTSSSVKITINTGGLWTGAVSNQWKTAGNWCGGLIPSSSDNVTISAGAVNMPVIPSGSFTCNNITIASGASLTLQSGCVLTVKGNLTNFGTVTDNGGTMVFNGSLTQIITGVSRLKNITVNNPYGLVLSNAITVEGIIKLVNGAIFSNGLLTLNLDAGGIAYADTDKGSIYGNITVKRSVASNKFHYLSAPLAGQTVSDWMDNIGLGNGRNYYYYDETNLNPDYNYGWTGINNSNTPLTKLKGYALYFSASKVMDNTGTYTHGLSPVSMNVTITHTGTNGADGWNLVGNPYPATVDWDASSGWTKTNVYGAIYCWDAANDRYTYYVNGIGLNGGSRYIAPMQAFWVRVDTTKNSGSLQVNSYARSSASSKFFKQGIENPYLKVAVKVNGNNDETVVRFMDDATEGFDQSYDAFKMMNEGSNPNIYSVSNGNTYAINSVPMPEGEVEIPLTVVPNGDGVSSLQISGMEYFDDSYTITLKINCLRYLRI